MDVEGQGHKKERRSREKPSAAKSSTAKSSARKATVSEGILPKVASEDEPRSWGDGGGYDHDAWLKEQRPPHWG